MAIMPFKNFSRTKTLSLVCYIEGVGATIFDQMMILGWPLPTLWQGQTKVAVSLGLGMYYWRCGPYNICLNNKPRSCDSVSGERLGTTGPLD